MRLTRLKLRTSKQPFTEMYYYILVISSIDKIRWQQWWRHLIPEEAIHEVQREEKSECCNTKEFYSRWSNLYEITNRTKWWCGWESQRDLWKYITRLLIRFWHGWTWVENQWHQSKKERKTIRGRRILRKKCLLLEAIPDYKGSKTWKRHLLADNILFVYHMSVHFL